MRFRRFKLLNESERAAIAQRASAALDEWRRNWTTDAARSGNTACAAAACDELVPRDDWSAFSTDAGTLYLAHADRASDVVRAAITARSKAASADRANAAENTIAADVLQLGLDDLMARLMAAEVTRSDAHPPHELWLRGSGAACVTLPLARGEIVVLLDSDIVSRMIGPASPRAVPRLASLANPQHCLGKERVEVGVWLGSAEIELATLQTLARNDVLLLDSRIDHPLRITVAGKDVSPRAMLGHAGEQKAVRLTTYMPV